MKKWIVVFAFVAACGREQPAPPPTPAKPIATTGTAATDPVPPPVPIAAGGSYDEAMIWLKTAPAFRFVIVEDGVKAEGMMRRKAIGAETIEFHANEESWRAEAGPRGVSWQNRTGMAWKDTEPPPYGNHLYQRATLALDPAKKEGTAQLVATEGTSNHYRFTDANLGNVHEVWVSTADNHVERIRIANVLEMTIQP